MVSTSTSAAWGGIALATSLLCMALMSSAQTQSPATAIARGVTVPNSTLYALTSDNSLYILKPGANQYVRGGRVDIADGGHLIGIDFRPADGQLYGLTDFGDIYTIDVSSRNFGVSNKVNSINPRFSGGMGTLVDFNPVANALRITGSNDQNIAVSGADGGNLNTPATQTRLTYAKGDVNFGKDPEIVGGAYSNNFSGATSTVLYLIDHDLDSLVTIATRNPTGSSNPGTGLLQTIGRLVDADGNELNLSPATDFDIYTDAKENNFLVGQSGQFLFSIDLAQIDPQLPLGRTQKVIVRRGEPIASAAANAPLTGAVFDVALVPRQ